MRFGIKEQIIMMEHENERMSYSFEPSDETGGAEGYHQTSYDPNYHQNGNHEPKKKNGVGGRSQMGIGLSVCMSIVKAHGGSMSARNLEEGTAVSFSLPLPWESEAGGAEDGISEEQE